MLKIIKKLSLLTFISLLVGCNSQANDDPICPEVIVTKVLTVPTKTEYNAGENFDPKGLSVSYAPNPCSSSTTYSEFENIIDGENLKHDQDCVYAVVNGCNVKVDIEVTDVFAGQITCVGDSLTEGHSWPTQSYPNYIKDYFDDSSLMSIKNSGKNGASFKTFGQYNPAYNTTTQYQDSLKGSPAVLTILLGTNDATNWANEEDDYVQDYTDLVNLYRETFGDSLNVIMLTSPRCIANTFGIPSDVICNEVVPLQRQLAEDLECELIDLNEEFEKYTDSELFRPNDGVHFTEKAAKITAELIANKIKEIYSL